MRVKSDKSLSVIGIKQTYFIKPDNVEKLKKIKKATKKGYSKIINDLIEDVDLKDGENNVQ